ncbi:MAG: hypothetical protein WB297_06100 [Actinomycetota bacterium]
MGPRIFGIAALRAPVVAVIRRGPTDWMHLSRWDLETPAYEPGAWLRGTIYPQRCDLSPDGRWFAYFTLKASADWELGGTYIVISRLPWLTALAGWGIGSTWTRGMQFVEDPGVFEIDEPDLGDLAAVRGRFGLRLSRADSFAVERRRGWTETADTPPRDEDDAWDERRGDRIVMEKARPNADGSDRLTVRGTYAAIRELHGHRTDVRYELRSGRLTRNLEDVQWAEWDPMGRLLVATSDGRLQIRDGGGGTILWEADEGELGPDPMPPPAEASTW